VGAEAPGLTLLVALATLVLTVLLYMVIPKGLFPTQDTGQLQARIETSQAVSYERMAALQQAAASALLEDPDVDTLSSVVGVDAANNTMLHTGSMLINLKRAQRQPGRDHGAPAQPRGQVAGVTLYLQPTQDLTIDAESGRRSTACRSKGRTRPPSPSGPASWPPACAKSQLRNVVTDAGATGAAVSVAIDRDSAARMSVTTATVDDALYNAFGQRIVSTIFTETNQYRVILEAQPGIVTTPSDLSDLQVRTGSGKPTPLSAFASVSEAGAAADHARGAVPGHHAGLRHAPGVALGSAVDAIRQAAKDIGMPASVTMTFLGAAGASKLAVEPAVADPGGRGLRLHRAGRAVRSYIHPLTILSTLPSAGVGALLALLVSGQDLA
jgi:multidrug efflux pump